MSKHPRIEPAKHWETGQYENFNPSYSSGYEDGKKAGKEQCASEIALLKEQITKFKEMVVMCFDGDVPLMFSQGYDTHELTEPVTAQHCRWFVSRIVELESQLTDRLDWQPIETAPKDQFLLLACPSGYTTIPYVCTTGIMRSDYHVGRWIDHANDDLIDWGMCPTHWKPLPEFPKEKS